jgi:hypothetical protein
MAGREETRQFRLLLHHFLGRFLDNELVSARASAEVTLIHILTLLALPGLLISFNLITKYVNLARGPAELYERAALDDRLFFVYFSMIVTGFVTIFEWDALFPDRRDYTVLTPLPIRARTVLAAKMAALALFLLLFTVVVNFFSTLLFPLASNRGPLLGALRSVVAHAAAVLAGNATVFLGLVGLQGAALSLLPPRPARQVTRAGQVLLLVLLLSLFFLMPRLSFHALEQNPSFADAFAPAWFVGLYETLRGGPGPRFGPLALRAVTAAAAALVLFLATYALAYRRHLRSSLESGSAGPGTLRGLGEPMTLLTDRLVLRQPNERAAFHFITQTMFRSPRHRLLVGAYFGVGLAFAVMGLVTLLVRSGAAALTGPDLWTLSAANALSFFTLIGMRVAFSIPVELEANWVFRLAGGGGTRAALTGVHRALVALGVAPIFLTLAPLYVLLWGWRTAVLHTAFGSALALLLAELLTLNLRKIPFACAYVPGKANLIRFWWVYLLGFTAYVYTTARLELRMLRNPGSFAFFFAAALAALLLLSRDRKHWAATVRLTYADEPDEAISVLSLR